MDELIKWSKRRPIKGVGKNNRIYNIDNFGWTELSFESRGTSLGWSPTVDIARKHCEAIEEYYQIKDK